MGESPIAVHPSKSRTHSYLTPFTSPLLLRFRPIQTTADRHGHPVLYVCLCIIFWDNNFWCRRWGRWRVLYIDTRSLHPPSRTTTRPALTDFLGCRVSAVASVIPDTEVMYPNMPCNCAGQENNIRILSAVCKYFVSSLNFRQIGT